MYGKKYTQKEFAIKTLRDMFEPMNLENMIEDFSEKEFSPIATMVNTILNGIGISYNNSDYVDTSIFAKSKNGQKIMDLFDKNDYKLWALNKNLIIDRSSKKKLKDYTKEEQNEITDKWNTYIVDQIEKDLEELSALSEEKFLEKIDKIRDNANKSIKN